MCENWSQYAREVQAASDAGYRHQQKAIDALTKERDELAVKLKAREGECQGKAQIIAELEANISRKLDDRWNEAIRAAAAKSEPISYRAHHASVRRTVQRAILALLKDGDSDG